MLGQGRFISQRCIGYQRDGHQLHSVIEGVWQEEDGSRRTLYAVFYVNGHVRHWTDRRPRVDIAQETAP